MVNVYGTIDGLDYTHGSGYATKLQWANTSSVGNAEDHRSINIHSSLYVSAGSHRVGFKVVVGTLSAAHIFIGGGTYTAFLANDNPTA
jgi:hypothetical protein